MSDLTLENRFNHLYDGYQKLQNEYRELQNKYHQTRIMLEEKQNRNTTDLTDKIKELTVQREAARKQLRKYAHATKLILASKNMLDMACDYLEVYDD